ncbi:MAG: hypothetical protein H6R35_22 [Bacteroidetes bacterium]|nr:hypothetical protein [Bacteroidota bacterium]
MKKLFLISGLFLIFPRLDSQSPVGTWTDHLRYNTAKSLAVTPEKVYASTGSSLLVYDKKNAEINKLSKINGLSETGISSIAWSEDNEVLVIAYLTGTIDLIHKNTIYNLPDIANKYLPVSKIIHRIRTSGRYAYLCSSFGIVVIDLAKKEVHDTWKPGPDSGYNVVFDIAFGNGRVYAATSQGVWFAEKTGQGLAYFGNWSCLNELPDPYSKCNHLIFSGNKLYVNVSRPAETGDEVYAVGTGADLFSFSDGVSNTSIDSAFSGFTITSPGMLRYFNFEGAHIRTISSYGWGIPDLWQGIIEQDYIWLADKNFGLVIADGSSEFVNLKLPGPSSNEAANITSGSGKTIICGGGTDGLWNSLKRAFMVSVHENYQFTNIVSRTSRDAMRACVDPGNSSHFFVSSWGEGLFEYNDNTLVRKFDAENSPLANGMVPGSGIKICGLAMDRSKNLWITQTDAPGSLKILKPDGSWSVSPITIDAPIIGDIISTDNGLKWITLPEGHGLFIMDDKNTPFVFTDDRSRKMTIADSDGKIINSVFSAAEDLEGNIWIGTDQGPVIYYNSDDIFEDDVKGYRIKVARNDGSGLADYMLGTESITAIAVDGANRKWLGTKSSGVYLLSADGTTLLKNYNERNSQLFSDSIASVAVDNITGEVWFGTSKGVLSVRELATSGKETFNNVYSFPNPVMEDYTGNVTITGLVTGTQIKITDISGNLVFETISEGGQATWDLSTYNGHRVSTGVYLIFCSNNEGSKSYVTKVLVLGR